MGIKIKQETINEAINYYKDNYISIVECAKKYNIGATTLTRYLKANGIEIKKNNGNKYTYNENYFETIDTEDKAYWLGFIAADGSIVNNGTALEIGLSAKDKNHLIKFINNINGDINMLKERTNTAGNGKTYKTVRVNVCSKKMCNDLFNLGIVPNKSLTLQFPKNIPNSLIKHYLRG